MGVIFKSTIWKGLVLVDQLCKLTFNIYVIL